MAETKLYIKYEVQGIHKLKQLLQILNKIAKQAKRLGLSPEDIKKLIILHTKK